MSAVPGLLLCVALAVAAHLLAGLEARVAGRAWVDALVLAILMGAIVRTWWEPGARWKPGIATAAKPVLEVAIVLLGLTLDVPVLLRTGVWLLVAIGAAVLAALLACYGLGRAVGLSPRVAALVACGNAICGNSAIAAAAPVIGAEGRDVAPAIAFTAVLGVVVVLALPALVPVLGLDAYDYGVVAGLTVYAVPQVLAATLPVSALSGEVGTLVKLVRVLMLGPVLLLLGTWARRLPPASADVDAAARRGRPRLGALIPWFVAGFLLLAAARAMGVVPDLAVGMAREASRLLTIVALAALGLGVDVRVLGRTGPRVAVAAGGGVLVLLGVAVVMVRLL